MQRDGDGGGRAEVKSVKMEFASLIIELGGEVDSLTVVIYIESVLYISL